MKTTMVAYRVGDLDRSLVFYTALGYVEFGRVEGTASGEITPHCVTPPPVGAVDVRGIAAWSLP